LLVAVRFSLVHPSRQRLQRADDAIREWRRQASGTHAVEHVLSVDADDPDLAGYRDLAARHGSVLVVGDNRTMVEAVNRGAAAASGEVLVSIADDFGCPPHWDEAIAGAIAGRTEAAVFVHDGIDGRIMTLPILSRAFYRRLGYIYHPAYISMYADDDLTAVAHRCHVVVDVRDRLLFPHRHASIGLGEADVTHARQNRNLAWWHGWRVFAHRRVDDFGDARRDGRSRLKHARVDAYYAMRIGGARLRSAWLPYLPGWARAAEARLRRLVLRGVARVTAQSPD
jgi:glycosyltransferase involved in cell wall biosynthesis